MRTLTLPQDQSSSQQEVLRRIESREAEGLVAHVRSVVALKDGAWIPLCGRIDIARPIHAPKFTARPVGSVRLLFETTTIPVLLERLRDAFRGEPFLVQGEPLHGHGMNTTWEGNHQTNDWRGYGASWPVFSLSPTGRVAQQVYLHEVIAAEGSVEAFDGSRECVRAMMAFRESGNGATDVRFHRFQVIEWDYRGVFRSKLEDGKLVVAVEPPGDTNLKLSLVARDEAGGVTRKTEITPGVVEVPVKGALTRVNMTLRHGEEVVCEAMRDLWEEEAIRQLGGHIAPSSSAPEVVGPTGPSTIAQLALGFLKDEKLAAMVTRDIDELDAATKSGANKAAILLVGSILEAVLLDVLGRNEAEARQRLGKKWPEKASLKDLIDAAVAITVTMPDGTTASLIPPLTGKKGIVVTDHRDLIHPRAEVRGSAPIDESTMTTMRGVLGEVLRDLRLAHERGILDEYGQNHVV